MTTRRNVVSKAALAVAGLAGVGVAGATRTSTPASTTHELTLYGRNWRANGDLPVEGERISVRGDLVDESDEPVGEFFAAGFAIGGGVHPAQGERIELHTFKLRDGTIIGSGAAGAVGTFAILGGTGRYASARGTYVAEQRHQEFGGDGSAKFVLRMSRDTP